MNRYWGANDVATFLFSRSGAIGHGGATGDKFSNDEMAEVAAFHKRIIET